MEPVSGAVNLKNGGVLKVNGGDREYAKRAGRA